MESAVLRRKWWISLAYGLAAGAIIVYVDNYMSGGEVSPVIIVALLLAATATAGILWDERGWIASLTVWVSLPGVHLIKHVLGLPDTLHPNTFKSIFYLAAFSLLIAAIGTGAGQLVRKLTSHQDQTDQRDRIQSFQDKGPFD